ncbi:MAG: type II toxin-antitoxin system antitoxin SocA domain-containing protein [Ignavibacteria bacterium]
MKPLELAYYIINNYSNFKLDKGGITPLKLQKLLYYIKAWGTVANVEFNDLQFYAWKSGPVNSGIYEMFKKYGKAPVQPGQFRVSVDKRKKTFIDFIIKNYIIFDAFTLSSMTHNEDPWIKTAPGEIIAEQLMTEYYSRQKFAKNFPLGNTAKFYPIKSNMDFSFEMDIESPEEIPELTYSSLDEFLNAIRSNRSKLGNSLNNMLNVLN